MRLIDANDVKKRGDCYPPDIRETIANILSHTKTVKDAVCVVRCKDCVHYHKADSGHPDTDWCKRLICGTIKPDFFCADGERKEDE